MSLNGWQDIPIPCPVHELEENTRFNFSCHKGLNCFTECCRLLDLALSPYDLLRLRRSTGLISGELLERYVIVEQEENEAFPRLFLTMIDDGRGSCAFVTSDGCSVYEHRPGACRAYPVGRAVQKMASGEIGERFVLLQEDHCLGFQEKPSHTANQYCSSQGLATYNHYNDALTALTQNVQMRNNGFIPSQTDRELIFLSLYDLDEWRKKLLRGEIDSISIEEALKMGQDADEDLLLSTINWLVERLFP